MDSNQSGVSTESPGSGGTLASIQCIHFTDKRRECCETHTNTHTNMYTHTHIQIHTQLHACVHIQTHTHTPTAHFPDPDRQFLVP